MYKLLEYCTGLFFAFFIAYLVLSAVERLKGRDDPFEGRLGPVLFVLHSGWVLSFFVLLFFGAMIGGTGFSLIMLAALVNLAWRAALKITNARLFGLARLSSWSGGFCGLSRLMVIRRCNS
jgi:hypothetical protein